MSLAGLCEAEIVGAFCERLLQAGVPLARAMVLVDTLHPIYEGRAFRWNPGTAQAEVLEYERTREGANDEGWRRSPLFYMLQTHQSVLRFRHHRSLYRTETRHGWTVRIHPPSDVFRRTGD